MNVYKCFIVYHSKDKLCGFTCLVTDVDKLRELLHECKTDNIVPDVFMTDSDMPFDVKDITVFDSMTAMNDYFDNSTDNTHLIILKDNNWYCRLKGSNTFNQLTFEEEIPEENPDDYDAERITSIADELMRLKESHEELVDMYNRDRKWTFYVMVALIILLAVVGVLAIF